MKTSPRPAPRCALLFSPGVLAVSAGTLVVEGRSTLSPVLGGRGNLSGADADTGIFFLAVHVDWRL